MTTVDTIPAAIPPAAAGSYAGFWRRFLAWIIDWLIVSVVVSSILIGLGFVFPGLGRVVTMEPPFGLFTTTRTFDVKSSERTLPDGRTEKREDSLVERRVLGMWTYLFRREKTTTANSRTTDSGNTTTTSQSNSKDVQLDPVTREPITTTHVSTFVAIALLLYWTLMEAGRNQASFGKMALGLRVTDEKGRRLSIAQSFGRNILKFLSAIILCIGFMMAGWTRRKQGLHDIIARALVVEQR